MLNVLFAQRAFKSIDLCEINKPRSVQYHDYHYSSMRTVSSSGDRCLFHLVPFLPSHHVIQGALSRPFHLLHHLGRRGLVTHYVH